MRMGSLSALTRTSKGSVMKRMSWIVLLAMVAGLLLATTVTAQEQTVKPADMGTVASKTVTTDANTNATPDNPTTTKTHTEEVNSVMSKYAMKHEERMAEIAAKVAIEQAKHSQPKIVSPCPWYFGGCAPQPVFMNGAYYTRVGQTWVRYDRPAGYNVYGTSRPTARRR